MNLDLDGDKEFFLFDLDGLARIVDVAFNEGRIAELQSDPNYSLDSGKIKKQQLFELLINIAKNTGKKL